MWPKYMYETDLALVEYAFPDFNLNKIYFKINKNNRFIKNHKVFGKVVPSASFEIEATVQAFTTIYYRLFLGTSEKYNHNIKVAILSVIFRPKIFINIDKLILVEWKANKVNAMFDKVAVIKSFQDGLFRCKITIGFYKWQA